MHGLSVASGQKDPVMGVSGARLCCRSRLLGSVHFPGGSGAAPTAGGAPTDLVAVGLVAGGASAGSSPRGMGGGESPP
eukprot:5007028-Pyramimonas_sp.AAC.1